MIEAGARCVALAFTRWPFGRMLRGDYNWDWHKDLLPLARKTLPLFDLGLWALIEGLAERDLLNDIAVVVWGEFGRTPRINRQGGRRTTWRHGDIVISGQKLAACYNVFCPSCLF